MLVAFRQFNGLPMVTRKTPYLPLGQVRRNHRMQRCGVKRFVPAYMGIIAHFATVVNKLLEKSLATSSRKRKTALANTVFLTTFLVRGGYFDLTSAEQQRDTPSAAKSHQSVDDPADDGRLPAEDPCHDVKLEQTDGTPVDGTDDHQDQCKSV